MMDRVDALALYTARRVGELCWLLALGYGHRLELVA
jgi:hypothetical protein